MKTISKIVRPCVLLITSMFVCTVNAVEKIAVLSFELNDITTLPNTQKEQLRTASIKPLLEQAILQNKGYKIIKISPELQQNENAGFGYLFRFHDIAARLGQKAGADWIIVGQHSKPSFLYSYLMANVVNVKTRQRVARFDIELKGNHQKVTQRGVKKLARELDKVIVKFNKI